MVDVHAFTPERARRRRRARAGFDDVRVRGEELLANWFGWANRALEATADPEDVPWRWRQYAYRGYLALQQVDRALLEPRLPPAIFYNLMITAREARARPRRDDHAHVGVAVAVVGRAGEALAHGRRQRRGRGRGGRAASRIRSASLSACLSGKATGSSPAIMPGPLRCA